MSEKQPLNDVETEILRYATEATLLIALFVAIAPTDVLEALRDQIQHTLDSAMRLRDFLSETRTDVPDDLTA